MNELELVRRFREDVPELSPVEIQASRAALMERLSRPSPTPPSRGRVRVWRRVSVGATIAAAVTLAVVLPMVLPGGGPGGAEPAAAAALRRVAAVAAASQPGGTPAAGEYVYTKSRSVYLSGFNEPDTDHPGGWALVPFEREVWIGPDGSGRIVETSGPPTFFSEQDRQAWIAAGSPDLGDNIDEAYGPGKLHFLDLSNLSADPSELLGMIEAQKIEGGPPGDWESFTIVGDLLRETYAPPAVRSALYQAAAQIPGVEYVGRVTDAAGRPGLAVAYTHAGLRHELIFDPNTSQLLGEQYLVVDPTEAELHAAPGTVVGYAVYLAAGVVGSVSDRAH
jgi:hypothetical protein